MLHTCSQHIQIHAMVRVQLQRGVDACLADSVIMMITNCRAQIYGPVSMLEQHAHCAFKKKIIKKSNSLRTGRSSFKKKKKKKEKKKQ